VLTLSNLAEPKLSPFATRMQLLGSLNSYRITHACTHTSDVQRSCISLTLSFFVHERRKRRMLLFPDSGPEKDLRVCVDCLFLRSPSRVPYRTELIPCAKRAAYPDPPPGIPLPESIAAQAVYQLRYKSTEYCSWVSSGPKCFQVLGLVCREVSLLVNRKSRRKS
jgi:hypothetical protein